ncbi:MAG: efflux RND transporter periplasmic adaptor subunit [Opitutaceae bacterium]|nr:efflux RND transporter periplasmic adaptor subunit [Opitutaceae bacterium]
MSAKNGSFRFALKVLVVVALLAVAGYFAMINFGPVAMVEPVQRGKAVDAVTGSVNVNADGGIRPLKSEAAGRVLKCDALAEDRTFKQGDVLVELDDSDVKREMANAERDFLAATEKANYEKEHDPKRMVAREALENAQRLFKRNEVAEKDVEAAKRVLEAIDTAIELANLDAKKAKADFDAVMERTKRLLEKMKILAPFDGSVQTPLTFEGAIIGLGETVAMILSNARVVTAKVSEDSIAKVKPDQPAKVTLLAYPGEQFDARVIRISETADESQRFNVFLDVKTDLGRLKHGSTGEARITVGERENQPLVARRAVFSDDHVYVVKNGVVEKRKIEIGYRALNYVEVRAGLQPGELVIADNLDEFYPGQRVRLPKKVGQKN